MGVPGALHHHQLPLVQSAEVEDVELLVPVVGLVQVVLVLGRVKVFFLMLEHLSVGWGHQPSGLGSELQVPVHGHAKQTAPF